MDWITGIQKAIDYTEVHLEEGIDFEKVGPCKTLERLYQ